MLAVTGYRSKIVQELRQLLPPEEEVLSWDRDMVPRSCERYLFCAGVLRPKTIWEQSDEETNESFFVNCVQVMRMCDGLLRDVDKARIVVMGSESGFTWSYDGAYAASKAALHRYVETKKLKPQQQLVCVAPSIIEDCGMTLRREDKENLERRRNENPKRRFLTAIEVARVIHFLLYVDQGYISGQVIRVNGGPA